MREFRSPLGKVRRLLKVVEYLQSGRSFNARDLAEMCGVSRRQMFRDLKALQDSGVSLLYDAKRQAYWLPQPSTLPPLDLTLPEALSLIVLASNLGDSQRGIPLQSEARSAALKLSNSLPPHLRKQIGELSDLIEVWGTPHHPLAGAQQVLQTIQQALCERRRIRATYQSLHEGREILTVLNPYRLLYCRHTWYVVGRSSLHRAVQTFHIGRFRTCELLTEPYAIPPRFSLERYLGNAWQLIREPRSTRDVHIRFQPLVAQNVAEVVWHKTQQTSWNDDGTLDFRVRVDGVREISWWVLGYGDQAEVLEPPELRELIVAALQRMNRLYGLSPEPPADADSSVDQSPRAPAHPPRAAAARRTHR